MSTKRTIVPWSEYILAKHGAQMCENGRLALREAQRLEAKGFSPEKVFQKASDEARSIALENVGGLNSKVWLWSSSDANNLRRLVKESTKLSRPNKAALLRTLKELRQKASVQLKKLKARPVRSGLGYDTYYGVEVSK